MSLHERPKDRPDPEIAATYAKQNKGLLTFNRTFLRDRKKKKEEKKVNEKRETVAGIRRKQYTVEVIKGMTNQARTKKQLGMELTPEERFVLSNPHLMVQEV